MKHTDTSIRILASSTLAILSTVASLSLVACKGEVPCDQVSCGGAAEDRSDDQRPASARSFEIQVVGEGQVAVLEPIETSCSTEQGICSFEFPLGSELRLQGAFVAVDESSASTQLCSGPRGCAFDLDQKLVIVADFEEARRWQGLRPQGLLPGTPSTVVDPAPFEIWYRNDDEAARQGGAVEE